jgi:hypothetical protein
VLFQGLAREIDFAVADRPDYKRRAWANPGGV